MTDVNEKKPVVLVIDDSDSIRLYAAELLRSAGYAVHEARDGKEGLTAVEACKPDVLLLDVEMPGMTGYEVLAELNRTPRLLSVIMFTTLSAMHDIVNGLERGADDYICKPFQPDELQARVKAAVRTACFKKQLAEAREQAEAAHNTLKATQRKLVAQEKVASVARLAAGAAHNINNPLGFLLSNLVTLERYTDNLLAFTDELSSQIRKTEAADTSLADLEKSHRIPRIKMDMKPLVQETKEGGERIGMIVRRLARLEMGVVLQQNAVCFDLGKAVETLAANSRSRMPEGIEIRLSVTTEQLPISAPLTLINAALEEIMVNATEAMAGRTGTITIDLSLEDGSACLKVCDEGPGIADEVKDQLFEPFFTTKDQQVHVGLGLTIAERFVDLGGGQIVLSARAGKGAECCLTMPLKI